MAIKRVEIKDFLVFKGEFAVDFCPGVNVLIGANGTGKTTLLREMYYVASRKPHYLSEVQAVGEKNNDATWEKLESHTWEQLNHYTWSEVYGNPPDNILVTFDKKEVVLAIYFPEKDILEHSRGLLPFIEQKQTGFGRIYKNLLISAQDIPTSYQNETQRKIGDTIVDIIGGVMEWVPSEGTFYTVRTDGLRIPFSHEASGFKKLGCLGLLVASGQLKQGTVLFWDEPENSLNPEHIPELVNILLELSRNGVQIFLATHSEIFAGYFDAFRKDDDDLLFFSLYKDEDSEQIRHDASDRFDLLTPNNLTAEQAKLYECEVERAFSNGKR